MESSKDFAENHGEDGIRQQATRPLTIKRMQSAMWSIRACRCNKGRRFEGRKGCYGVYELKEAHAIEIAFSVPETVQRSRNA
ncbi:MAG: hypothetical protein ACLTJG_01695 [[Clostridium] innocuum]